MRNAPHETRTRFLEQLDWMVRQDRAGAIMDMLQVLREQGVVSTICATVAEHPRYAEDESYKRAIKKNLATSIGILATEKHELEIIADPSQPQDPWSPVEWILRAEFIRDDGIRGGTNAR